MVDSGYNSINNIMSFIERRWKKGKWTIIEAK
jgi:hypothetical protein